MVNWLKEILKFVIFAIIIVLTYNFILGIAIQYNKEEVFTIGFFGAFVMCLFLDLINDLIDWLGG